MAKTKKEKKAAILTKKPGFAITQFSTNNPFQLLTEYRGNYFEQYILYVAKSIDYIANKVASSTFGFYKEDKLEFNNVLESDLRAFNPYMNLWEARKLRMIHLMLTGVAAWYIDRDPMVNKQVEYYPLDPTSLRVATDSSGLPIYYTYSDANGKEVHLDMNDVIYFKTTNPSNWFEGQSEIKKILYWSNAYAQGTQYNMNKLGNSVTMDKLIVYENASPSQRERLEEQLQEKYSGVRNAGRSAVVTKKPEIVEMSPNQKDLDYVEGMKMLRQDILAFFGIPEALLFPSATNSNSKEARTLFESDTLEPKLQEEFAAVNEQLVPKVIGSRSQSILYYFKFDPVVEKDIDALFAQAALFYEKGLYTRNQALKHVGNEPVATGDVYVYEQGISEDIKQVKEIAEKTKNIEQDIRNIIDNKKMQEFKEKNMRMIIEQEGQLYTTTENFFIQQAQIIVPLVAKTRRVSAVFKMQEQNKLAVQVFAPTFSTLLSNTSIIGNKEIAADIFKLKGAGHEYKTKAVSAKAIDEIAQKLEYFADEINSVTKEELVKLFAQGIESGFDSKQLQQSILDKFNSYIDGAKNVDVLTKYGFYVEQISLSTDGNVVVSSTNRFNAMLEKITQAQAKGEISKAEMQESLKALKGLINPADPVGATVDSLLSSIYKVSEFAKISYSRAITIARTESTFIRNLGFYDLYEANPYVDENEWLDASDSDVRDSHRSVKPVKQGNPFIVGGSKMRFPGDSSLGAGAEEIVNCRCRVVGKIKL